MTVRGVLRHTCDHPKLIKKCFSNGSEVVPDDSAIVEADESWSIMTGPNFGCVNWEAKPEEGR